MKKKIQAIKVATIVDQLPTVVVFLPFPVHCRPPIRRPATSYRSGNKDDSEVSVSGQEGGHPGKKEVIRAAAWSTPWETGRKQAGKSGGDLIKA